MAADAVGHAQRVPHDLHRCGRGPDPRSRADHLRHRLLDGLRGAGAPQRADRRGGRMPHADQPQPDRDLQRRAEHLCGLQPDEHGGGQGSLLQTQDLRRGLHSVGLRGETARRPAGQRRDLRRRQLLPHVPAGVSGGRDFDRRHGRDGRIPASDRQGSQPPAGAGHDPAGHLPVPQPVQPLSGLRHVRHARDHHGHHPADDAHRHRHDRRHMARIRATANSVRPTASGCPRSRSCWAKRWSTA